MANKTFNTRVKNKRDTAANWEAVATTFQPLDGELIIVDTAAGKTRFKVGRYDTAKERLLYYNEIPFTDEYLYNDLNESQGKIYDKLKGIDDKSIIEMTLESVFDNTKFVNYRIGLWQFGKTGFYKLNIPKRGTTATQLFLYAQKIKEDGTTPEDPFSQDNLLRISPLTGDKQVESVFVQVDYTDTDTLTVYKVQFLNVITFPGTININTYNKTTQKWDFTSVTESSAKWANNATQVSNALTLTKGDTTTKFDGSTAQTVEIPTKTSELTNDSFVSYTEQALTKDQQNQAKTNLGIDVLTGNTTTITPTQVKEAILAGRPIAITYTDTTYGNLTFTSFGYSLENNVVVANLVATSNDQYIFADLTGIINTNYWTLQTTELGTSTDIANNYVKYSESQTLTDEQKAQARVNIGAVSSDELVQSDWNQNDTTAKDYIKNRICYEEETVTELGNTAEVWHNLTNGSMSTPISYRMNGKIYKDLTAGNGGGNDRAIYNGSSQEAYLVVINYYYSDVSQIRLNYPSNVTDFQFVKIENTVKQIDSKFIPTVNPDWNQNDETAKDYIKNRPGAYFSGETIEITQSLENLTWHTQGTLKIIQIQRTDIPDKLYENIPYEICWGNEKYYVKLTSIEGQLKFGDTDNDGMPVFTNYPFFIQPVPSHGLAIALPNTSTPPSSISIKFNQGLVKLSEGYIDQIPGKISLYNITSNICSVDTLEIGVIEDNEFYGVENNQIGYLPTSNGVSSGLALFSPIPPFNQARMKWSGADSLSQFLGNSKSFNSNFGDNVQENVLYNQALSEIHRYSYTLDHCRATIGFAGNDYYNFKLYCDTTTSTKAIPTAIGYTVKNNKVYQLKVTANNLSTNGQVDFVFIEFLDLDTIASKSDIPTIDDALSSTSENPVQNKVVKTAIDDLQASIDSKSMDKITNGDVTLACGGTDGTEYLHLSSTTDAGCESDFYGNSIYQYLYETDGGSAPALYYYSKSQEKVLGGLSVEQNYTNGKRGIEALSLFTIDGKLNVTSKYDLTLQTTNAGNIIVTSNNKSTNKFDVQIPSTVLAPTEDMNPATKKYVDDQMTTINNQLGGLTGAMHFIGKAAVDITDGSTTDPQIANYTTKEKGDVILGKDDHKEFVWNGAIWEELGDEGSYALKTTTINGKALSDNITLTASDVGAASVSTIETMQAAINSKPSAADAVYTATAESTDGVAYTATVSGIDSLTVGASFIMIPNKASTSKAPTLNVNGLGAKPIRRRLSSLTTSLQQGYSTNWIALNKPFTVVYDGTAWVIEGLTKTDGADVYGAVAQATADAKGNNIADTYATIAMLQSLLPKVTTITLTSNWVGDASPYYQDIALSCVTETSIVDLQPTPEQLNSWQDDGIAFTTLSGNDTVRVYVAGGKPSSAISVQVRVQEVTVI